LYYIYCQIFKELVLFLITMKNIFYFIGLCSNRINYSLFYRIFLIVGAKRDLQDLFFEKESLYSIINSLFSNTVLLFFFIMNNFLLDFLALGAILSGILVITSKNPVISVLFLISVFVNVAGYLVLLGVGFIGISYLIVYVGAIAILFLFVVMMLNLQLTELSAVGTEYTQNLPLGTIIGSLFLFELVSIVPGFASGSENDTFNISTVTNLLPQAELGILNWFNSVFLGVESAQYNPISNVHYTFNTAFGTADTQFASFLQIQSVGYSIYTTGALWLIVASVILLLAMVGPITLSMNKTPTNSPNKIASYFITHINSIEYSPGNVEK